jgi:hypothetical protein
MLFSNCSSSELHFLLNQDLFFFETFGLGSFLNLKPGVIEVRGDFEIFSPKRLDLDLEKYN